MSFSHTLIRLDRDAPVTLCQSHTRGTVYGLEASDDPGVVRYVGFTVQKLKDRVAGHRKRARAGKAAPVWSWIRDLHARGQSVVIVPLEANATPEAEQVHMDRLAATGRLLNAKAAGVAGAHDEASRARMSVALKRACAEPAWRASHRGERHNLAKLTDDDVRAIRRRYAAGGILQRELAAEYGVSDVAISYLLKGKTWAHVTDSAEAA